MERTQFTFYESFFKAISRIKKDADRCKAYDAICSYALYGNEPDMDTLPDAAAIAFELSKPNLDSSRRKAENGKNGGSKKQTASKTEANEKQTASKKEKEIEIEKEKEYECIYNPLPPKGAFEVFAEGDAELLTALKAFEAMRKKIKKPMSENAKGRLVAKLKHMSSDRGTWIAMLHQSEDRCWSDVYELKTEQKPKKSPNNMVGVNFNPDLERIKKNNDHLDKLLRELEGDDYMEKIESRWRSGS